MLGAVTVALAAASLAVLAGHHQHAAHAATVLEASSEVFSEAKGTDSYTGKRI